MSIAVGHTISGDSGSKTAQPVWGNPTATALDLVGAGVSTTPLRWATATNVYPTSAVVNNLGTAGGLVQTDNYQEQVHEIGQDLTTLVICLTNQWMKAANGISNVGNPLHMIAVSVVYNGIAVPVTTAGQQTFDIADAANWFADGIPASACSVTKFSKGTQVKVKAHWRTTAAATEKFPQGRGRGNDVGFYADPTKVSITNDVYTPGVMSYSMINGGVNNTDAKFSNSLLPLFVAGYHIAPSVALLGDSKTAGTGDTLPACNVLGAARALFANPALLTSVQCSGINMGCSGGMAFETYTATAAGNLANHLFWYTLANYAIVGYGTNLISFANQQTMYTMLRAQGISKIIQRSLTPRTTPLNTDPVTVTALTTDTVTTTVTGTMADTSGLIEGQSYPISGASPAVYNGTFAIHIVNGTTFTYTAGSVPASNATGTLVLDDQWRTTQYQTVAASWGVGSAAETFESQLRGLTATDVNFAYYQSQGERAGGTVGTASYWLWGVNGTVKFMTADGLHETAGGYELNVGSAGSITTQAGGTVAQSLRAYVGTLT
jgi:hypothetical protein